MSEVFCGIDFGTSNSSIAIASSQKSPMLVRLEGKSSVIPSAIFYENGTSYPYLGMAAMNAFVQGREGRLMRSLKRVLGTDLMNSGTYLNGKTVKFENVLAQFISHLKQRAEEQSESNTSSVVMGRPIHFRDNDPKGDKQAEKELMEIAIKAGFKNVVFQYEPIAAAFAHEKYVEGEELACVIDIGGGTSDFSIIRIGKQRIALQDRRSDLLASSGVRIGGNDFDKDLCLNSFMPVLGYKTTYGAKNLPVPSSQYFDLAEWSKVNSVYSYSNRKIITEVLSNAHQPQLYGRLLEVINKECGHNVLNKVEKIKIELTDRSEASTTLGFLNAKPQISVLRSHLENAISQDVFRIGKSIEDCLKQAQIKAEQVGMIVLTGGSTEIPYVRQQLCSYFPHAEISDSDKLSSVGLGLAYDSLRRFA